MSSFKCGDAIRYLGAKHNLRGKVGTVVVPTGFDYAISVFVDGYIFWATKSELRLLSALEQLAEEAE